jgi:ABC-type multidrug transport system fused ATPase/permease subunit
LRVDGTLIGDDNLRAWQATIGYVPQQIYLADASVTTNIAFGVPPDRVDHAAVERAARIANLHQFVTQELPRAYETTVGERGVRLSGGQRQRIGIARALYHDPHLLVMDEATSALDNLTEQAVMEAVHNVGNRKTVIIIAHRLSTVRDCDTIVLLEDGEIVAQGTFTDLAARDDAFRAMINNTAR